MPFRVMTYNIRNSGANDGPNRWELRRDLWVDIVRKFDPDLLGVQEVLADQYDYLKEKFPDYTLSGVARDDGKRKGEWSLILFRTARFKELRKGNIWLSEKYDVPGSKSWDAACCRLCSWVRLKDRRTGKQLVFCNLHLDHVGEVSRRESAKLMVDAMAIDSTQPAIVMTGDFNCTELDEPHRLLTQNAFVPLIDSYRSVHPVPQADENSFPNFSADTVGLRIDWILHSDQLKAKQATIDRTRGADGRYASDHDPVTAVLEWVDEK